MDPHLHNAGGSTLPGDDEEYALRRLERLVAGEGSPADEAELMAWIGDNPNRQRMIARVRAQWGAVPETHDVETGWARMARHLQSATPSGASGVVVADADQRRTRPLTVVPHSRRSPFRAVAVGIAALLVATVAFWWSRPGGPLSQVATTHVYSTSVRQRADVRLPDGTHVLIAPESRVRLAADFGTQRRDVYVEGEAYFEVVHDSTRPFTVFAANSSTLDVGTAFVVRSYPEERVVQVVVTEGKVVMSGAGPLAAGDVARLTAEGHASVRRGIETRAFLGWTHGELVFEDAPLGQVLQDLRRWYGVEVRVADSVLKALPFTGSLRGASPVEGVELIAATLGLRLTRDGPRIVLHR